MWFQVELKRDNATLILEYFLKKWMDAYVSHIMTEGTRYLEAV